MVWFRLQIHKGVIPSLDQISGSVGVLVTGSHSYPESLDLQTWQQLSFLLSQVIDDDEMLILATGGGAEVRSFPGLIARNLHSVLEGVS